MNAPTDAVAVSGDARHVPVLDGIRGLAILLVMQSHFWGFTFGVAGRAEEGTRVDRWIAEVISTGWIGVDLFFVLSGFLITGILYDAKSSGAFFRNFYARRFLRIFPLYYAFLAAVLVLGALSATVATRLDVDALRGEQGWYWSYLINVGWAFKDLDVQGSLVHSIFWSLAVEEQFYVLWPALVLLIARRPLIWVCAALVVAAPLFRAFVVAADGTFNVNAAHILMPARIDTLAIGALLALAARGHGELAQLRRYAPHVLVLAAVAVVALFAWQDGLSAIDGTVQVYGFSALALGFGALLLMTVTAPAGSALARVFGSDVMTFFGRYAYGLYVVHLAVLFLLGLEMIEEGRLYTLGGWQAPFNLLFSIACTSIAVVIAWLSWHLFESQVLKLKRYFRYDTPRHARPAVEPVAAPEPSTAV